MSPLALSVRFLQTQTDRRLVELARSGHERAFEALVQRYRRPLLKYCRRLTASETTAEDVLQQALLQAWVALASPEVDVRDARAWLYRIVHNAAMSQLRRPVHDSLEATHSGLAGGAEDELERRLEARAALAGIASLPELQREVMLGTALEGRSHDEVADALGLSHGAVRGLIYRARAALRAAAAAVVPSPVIHWAVRQGAGTGRSAAFVEAVAGGGSIGVGGLLLKGGAVVAAAGAVATAAGIAGHASHRHVRPVEARLLAPARSHGSRTSGGANATTAVAVEVMSGASGDGARSALSAVRSHARSGSSASGAHRIGLSNVGGFGFPGGRSGSGRAEGHGDGGSSGAGGPTGTSGPSGSGGSDGSGSTGSHHDSGASSGSGAGGSSGSGSGGGSGSGSHDGSGDGGSTAATSASVASSDGSGDGSRSSSGSGAGTVPDGGSGGGTGSDGGAGSRSGSGDGSSLSPQSSSSGYGGSTTTHG